MPGGIRNNVINCEENEREKRKGKYEAERGRKNMRCCKNIEKVEREREREPVVISTGSLIILSGFFLATSSIFIPPSELATINGP